MGNDSKELYSNALGSATAGIISRIFTHPLDTIKAKLQAPPQAPPQTPTASKLSNANLFTPYKGPLDVLQKTSRSEGIRGFYRGFGAILVGGTPGTILYLCSYDLIKKRLALDNKAKSPSLISNNEFLIHFSSGMLAETIACLVYVPVDVIKERLQVQQIPSTDFRASCQAIPYKGSWDALKNILQTEGINGIYKGYGATLASFGPFSALYFVFYEQLKQNTISRLSHASDEAPEKVELPFHHLILCSASAGALASWLTSPLDMAKLRLQIQRGANVSHNNQNLAYKGMIDCIRKSYIDGGIAGTFRGAGARVLHFTPAMAITMTFYEKCRSFYAGHL